MSSSLPEQPRLGGFDVARPARGGGRSAAEVARGLVSAFQRTGQGAIEWVRSGEFEAVDGRAAPPRRPLGVQGPTVSVIVPCRDGAATLPATLRSLRRQSFRDWEAVVVDDGSVDATAEVAGRWSRADPRIRLIRESGRGVANARNAGLRAARGEWVLFLDCDDWLSPDALAHLLALTRRHPSAGVVKGRAVKVSPDGRRRPLPKLDLSEPFAALCCEGRMAIHSALVRRELVARVGGFDPSLKTSEDWDLWQRIARMGVAFAQSWKPIAFYRNTPQSLSKRTLQVAMDGLTVMRRGHAPDPRVPDPAPAHALGGEPDALPARELYFALWCAARAVAAGGDGLPVLALLRGPPPVAEPRSLGELMASGMADILALPERRLGRNWPTYGPKLARLLEALGPDQARVQALTLATIKARLHAGEIGDPDRLDLVRPSFDGLASEALQLVRGRRTVGLIAAPRLAARHASLTDTIVAQAERLPLREAIGAVGGWTSPRFWLAVAPSFARRLASAGRRDLGYARAALRGALTEGLQATIASRLPRQASAQPDAHRQALARLRQVADQEARRLAADLGPPPEAARRVDPQPRLGRDCPLALPALMYHRISREAAPGLARYSLAPEAFEAQLAHLRREDYRSVTPDELRRFLRFEAGLPPRSVMLTFDDAYLDFAAEAWPRLKRHGFSAVVFAVTGRVGQAADWDTGHGPPPPLMDWRQLRELAADGAAIESHGHSHRPLPRLSTRSVYEEAARSRAILTAAIGQAPQAFCYPYGAHDPASERALEECGYRLAFTTQAGACALGGSPMRISRIEVAGGDSLEAFARRVRGASRGGG